MIDIALLLHAAAAFLVVNVLVSLVQVFRGPTARHRLLVVVLLGTTGTAVLALLAEADGIGALRDAAIVLIALATLIVAVRVRAEQPRSEQARVDATFDSAAPDSATTDSVAPDGATSGEPTG